MGQLEEWRKEIMLRLDWIYIPIYLTSNQVSNSSHYFEKGDGIKTNHDLVNCVLEIAKNFQGTLVGKWILYSLERLKRNA
jgi:hypothetical protein